MRDANVGTFLSVRTHRHCNADQYHATTDAFLFSVTEQDVTAALSRVLVSGEQANVLQSLYTLASWSERKQEGFLTEIIVVLLSMTDILWQ